MFLVVHLIIPAHISLYFFFRASLHYHRIIGLISRCQDKFRDTLLYLRLTIFKAFHIKGEKSFHIYYTIFYNIIGNCISRVCVYVCMCVCVYMLQSVHTNGIRVLLILFNQLGPDQTKSWIEHNVCIRNLSFSFLASNLRDSTIHFCALYAIFDPNYNFWSNDRRVWIIIPLTASITITNAATNRSNRCANSRVFKSQVEWEEQLIVVNSRNNLNAVCTCFEYFS